MNGVAAVIAVAPAIAQAQSATVSGGLGNFDVINNTGHDAHGFEIEIEGLQPNDVYYQFSMERYGAPQVLSTPTGVPVRGASAYDAGTRVPQPRGAVTRSG
jgi:hypothetical protein